MDTSINSTQSNNIIPLLKFQQKQSTPQRQPINIPLIDLSEQNQETELTSESIQTVKQFSSNTSQEIFDVKKEEISYFQNWQNNLEQKISNPGAFYVIVGVIIFSSILQTKNTYFEQITLIQLVFMSLLVKFIINYLLIRKWNFKSYLENTQEHHNLKDISILFLLSFVILIYANSEFSLNIWFCSSLLLLIYEKIKKISIYYYKIIPYSVLLNSIACLILIKTQPARSLIIDATLGIISSGLFIVAITHIQKYDKQNNSMTLSHVVLFLQVSFLPIFFPLQNIIPLGLKEILFILISGILLQFAIEFFFRALQIYPKIKFLLLLTSKFVADLLFQTLFTGQTQQNSSLDYIAFLIITIVCSVMIIKKNKVQEENFSFPQQLYQ